MPVGILLNLLGKIVLMVLLGFLLKKVGIITEEFQKSLSNLLLKSILPMSILSSSSSKYSDELSLGLGKTALIAGIYYIISLVFMNFLSKYLKLELPAKKIFITMSVFANTAFIGFPVIGELFGSEGILYAVIYNMFYQLFLFTYGIYLLSQSGKMQLKAIYTNPITLSSFASVIIFLSPFRFPVFIQETLSSVGGMTVPLSMMIVGCTLVGINPASILKDKYSYLVSVLRLLLFPLIMLFILKLIGVSTTVASTCVVMTALPSGSLNVILAEQYNCNPKYAARTVIQSMVLMAVTLPIIIGITNIVL